MITYLLNGQPCTPLNHKEITYTFNYDTGDNKLLEIEPDILIFVNDDMKRIQTWRATWGDYIGMPLTVKYSNGLTVEYILDFSDGLEVKTNSLAVKIRRLKGYDHFKARADGMAFNYPGLIWSTGDFRTVDFLVVEKDLATKSISLLLMIFVLGKETVDSISKLSENVESLIQASTPTAGVPPSIVTGAVISAAIRVVLNIAYTVTLIAMLTKLIKDLVELIFPPIRQYYCIQYKHLIEKACNFLGYQLQSNILNQLSGLTVLPQPIRGSGGFFKEMFFAATLAQTKGYPTAGDSIPTLGTAIDTFCRIFNCEMRVNNNTVIIEPRSYFMSQAQPFPDTSFNLQGETEDVYTINSHDQFKRLVVKYNTDPMDFNTYDDTVGTLSEVSSEPINTLGKPYELFREYVELNIPFARGTRKNELNWFEKSVREVAKAFDKFLSTSFVSKIDSRKGCLQISDLYFSATKLLYLSGTKLVENQNLYIGTEKIVEYHADRFIENNQKRKYTGMPLRMTESVFFGLSANNYVLLNGKTAEIEKVSWSENDHVAEVDLSVYMPKVNEKTIKIF